MPSRQDQLHSYQYSQQRVVAALVTHDPDPARSPLRKAGTTALVSVLLAGIGLVGAGLYGLLTGQSSADPTAQGVVFQEKGSGARYVYLADGKLHPVLNYTSGMLLAEGDGPELETITPEKLAEVPLGATLGIPGAPDSLPGADALLGGRWSVCTDQQNTGNEKTRTIVLVGDKLADGEVPATENPPRAVLVQDETGLTMLIYNNHRYNLPTDSALRARTLSMLSLGGKPFPVSASWANAIPVAHDLVGPRVDHFGEPSAKVPNARVGQIVQDASDANSFSVVMPDGLASVTAVQSRLMRAALGGVAAIPRTDYGQLPTSITTVNDSGSTNPLPREVPALIDTTPSRICFTSPATENVNNTNITDGIRIDPTLPKDLSPVTAPSDGSLATMVHVTRGKGAVVVGVPGQATDKGADSGTYSIITDTGYSYPLASHAVLTKLGYAGVTPQRVPTAFTDLLPVGASLDPEAAKKSGGPGATPSPSAS